MPQCHYRFNGFQCIYTAPCLSSTGYLCSLFLGLHAKGWRIQSKQTTAYQLSNTRTFMTVSPLPFLCSTCASV